MPMTVNLFAEVEVESGEYVEVAKDLLVRYPDADYCCFSDGTIYWRAWWL